MKLTWLALLPLAAAPQERAGFAPPKDLTQQDLELRYFVPQRANADDLAEAVRRIAGRDLVVHDVETGRDSIAENIFTLGNAVAVYERPENVARILEMLGDMEKAYQREERTEFTTAEYTPRYLSAQAVESSLGPFFRELPTGQPDQTTRNVAWVRERHTFVLRDVPERVAEMRALLERIDVPEPQVVVTCFLIEVGAGADARLPDELVENLHRLVPDQTFRTVNLGIVRTSVLAEEIRIDMKAGGEHDYALKLRPQAYDDETNTWSLSSVGFSWSGHASYPIFDVSTSVRANEYTVLGAVGANPIFVALHLSPVE